MIVSRIVSRPSSDKTGHDRHPRVKDGTPSASTALVAIDPIPSTHRSGNPSHRPHAAFVAQLIATAERDPQTRSLRRSDPADANVSYLASSCTAEPVRAGRSLSKVA